MKRTVLLYSAILKNNKRNDQICKNVHMYTRNFLNKKIEF